MATVLNYHFSETYIMPRLARYSFGTNFQIYGQDNLPARRSGKSTGYDYAAFSGGGGGTGVLSGEGQIFPQGQYLVFYDMPITITEIDFGPTPTQWGTFLITDATVTTTKKVIPFQAGIAATGRQLDENEMDKLLLVAAAGTGNFTLYAEGADGPVSGKYKIGYQLGT
jgi:hypothetical protein